MRSRSACREQRHDLPPNRACAASHAWGRRQRGRAPVLSRGEHRGSLIAVFRSGYWCRRRISRAAPPPRRAMAVPIRPKATSLPVVARGPPGPFPGGGVGFPGVGGGVGFSPDFRYVIVTAALVSGSIAQFPSPRTTRLPTGSPVAGSMIFSVHGSRSPCRSSASER